MVIRGTYEWSIVDDVQKAIEALSRAVELANDTRHAASVYFANYWLGCALNRDCQWERAAQHIQVAVDINTKANVLWGAVAMRSSLACTYLYGGRSDAAFRTTREALRIAEESGDVYSKTWAYTYHGWSCLLKGWFDAAEPLFQKAIEACDRISAFRQGCDCQSGMGHCCLLMGKHEEAEKHFFEATRIAEAARYHVGEINALKTFVALARVLRGETDTDIETLCRNASENKAKMFQGRVRRSIGEIQMALGGPHAAEADTWFQRAIEADRSHDMQWDLARDHAAYGEWFQRTGDLSRAREQLGVALEIFRKYGADGWVTRTEEKLAWLT